MPSRPKHVRVDTPIEAKEKAPWYMKVIGFLIVGSGVAMLLTRYLTAEGKIEGLSIIEGLIILFPIVFGLIFLFPKSANLIVNGAKKLLPWTSKNG